MTVLVNFFNVCHFDCTTIASSGMVGPVHHTYSNSNRCVIELFGDVLCFCFAFKEVIVDTEAFKLIAI